MTKKVVLVLEEENPTMENIIKGYLVACQKKNQNVEFIIKSSKIDREIIKQCQEYGVDVTRYQCAIPQNAQIIPLYFPCEKEENPAFIYTLCKDREDFYSKGELSLAILTLLRTKVLHSYQSETEKRWISTVSKKYQLPYKKVYQDSLSITNLSSLSNACMHRKKAYSTASKKIETSHVNLYPERGTYLYEIIEMLQILKQYVHEQKVDLFLFAVHDFYNWETTLYRITGRNVSEEKYTTILTEQEIENRIEKEKDYFSTIKQYCKQKS